MTELYVFSFVYLTYFSHGCSCFNCFIYKAWLIDLWTPASEFLTNRKNVNWIQYGKFADGAVAKKKIELTHQWSIYCLTATPKNTMCTFKLRKSFSSQNCCNTFLSTVLLMCFLFHRSGSDYIQEGWSTSSSVFTIFSSFHWLEEKECFWLYLVVEKQNDINLIISTLQLSGGMLNQAHKRDQTGFMGVIHTPSLLWPM